MKQIENLRYNYLKHRELYFTEIEKFAKVEAKYPSYYKVLSEFEERLNDQFNSLLLLASEKLPYSFSILYRCVLESFFKSFYITSRLSSDRNDDVAEQFDKHLLVSEFLAEQLGKLEVEDLKSEMDEKSDFISYVQKLDDKLSEFSKTDQQEISHAISQFNLKTILKSLTDSLISDESINKEIGQYALNVIPEYSRTSTFVHGGPYGTMLVNNLVEEGKIEKYLNEKLSICKTMVCTVRENLLFSFDIPAEKFLEILFKLQKYK